MASHRSIFRGPVALSPAVRHANVARLGQNLFDVLVIGGGINGAGIARDAALRGLRVALIEKGDFASGTSSRSSKLIHGGLRYLEIGDFRLVREACIERDRLRRRIAPHLVKPLAFLFPVYDGDPVGLFRLELGMWAYDLLAAFRNIRMHRRLTRGQVQQLESHLRQEGLRGAKLYYDCVTDDARLTLETILSASAEGAVVANYVGLIALLKDGGKIVGARVRDQRTGDEHDVPAHVVVNATGPWVDEVRRLDDPASSPSLRLTKGVHIVVPRTRVGNTFAVVLRSPRDHRILFVIPWEDQTLIGTTDTDFTGSPDQVTVEPEDVDYLLEAVNAFFPQAALSSSDVVSSFAGLRPLVAPDDQRDPSAVSREEHIVTSSFGLISLIGGKLTTFRMVAENVTNKIIHALPHNHARRRRTRSVPLIGNISPAKRTSPKPLPTSEIANHLDRYGTRMPEVVAIVQDERELASRIVADLPYTKGEAVYAVQTEMAVQAEDILRRRTQISIRNDRAAHQAAEEIEALIAPLLDQKASSPSSGSSGS